MALLLAGMLLVAALYASVGHGGASGYLALMSLSSFAAMNGAWLKQHAWCLNLLVAALAFWQFRRAGFHLLRLTLPFALASVPLAFLGGLLRVDAVIYDVLLSLTLLWAAWRLLTARRVDSEASTSLPSPAAALPVGGLIGLASGVIGVGGGIFLSPIILLKRWATPKSAAATAALFIWVNSAAGLAGAAASGQLDLNWPVLAAFAVAVMGGGFLGASYGARIAAQSSVRLILVAVLLLAAGRRVLGLII